MEKMKKYWQQEYECMPRAELEKLQLSRLQATVRRSYELVAPYREMMKAAGITPNDIKSLDDLRKLPFTTKQHLRDNYPYGMVASPMSEIVRIHASSGTTGKPTVVCYTRNDIENWSDMVARAIVMAGGSENDIMQVAYGYGLFTGGLGLHYGAERLGAAVIPASGGNSQKQIMMMKDFRTNGFCCTPSYALYLSELMAESGVKPEDMNLRYAILGAEPWTDAMRAEIEARFKIKAYNIYGLSEVMGPGVSMECEAQNGMHIFEDHFIVEVIDPETCEVLPQGELGELVFTCITKEGMPMIRYRTRDLTRISKQPCTCGRTHVRMERVTGRSDDMLIIRGVNVFPSQIESVLLSFGQATPNYHLVVDRVGNLDTLEVLVEVAPDTFSSEIRHLEKIALSISRRLDEVLGISSKVTLVEPNRLKRSEGKAVRVTDKRKN